MVIPISKDTVSVQFANAAVSNYHKVTVQFGYKDKLKEVTCVLLPESGYEVIMGINLIKEWKLMELPVMSSDDVNRVVSNFKLKPVDQLLPSVVNQEIVYLPEKDKLMSKIQAALEANKATWMKHSTVGEVEIVFETKELRKQGIWSRQASLGTVATEKVSEQIADWLKRNVIEPADDLDVHTDVGPCNTSMFIVDSAGKFRVVLNFKPLNSRIKDDTCELPCIQGLFDRIAKSNAVVFSKIDLKQAFLQIPLRLKDRNATAFTFNNTRYRFVTAPLGLKTMPSIFQRWIAALLQKKGCNNFAVNFVDDIIIFSNSVDEHVEHVKAVLNALTEYNLTIAPEKFVFCATAIPVLGLWLDVKGVRPNYSKLLNMLEWERPSTQKQKLRLLGILNYFRKFVRNFAEVVTPIREIMGKTFVWEKQKGAEEALRKVYKLLVDDGPFLYFPVKKIPLELATDASAHAIAGTLFQVVEGKTMILGYVSRVLKDAERNYSIPKKEFIAVVYCILYFEEYLKYATFKLHCFQVCGEHFG